MKSVQMTLLLALLLPIAGLADAQTNKPSSFKSGFSSQKASSTRSGSSFGSFGPSGASGARSMPPARAPAQASRNSGFGSFGGSATAAPQQSDSALSQRLSKKAAEERALNTLDARRRAEQDAMNAAARPVPSGPLPGNNPYAGRGNDGIGQQVPPVIVQQGNGGIGNVITGFLLGRTASPSHAARNGYPGVAAKAAPAAAGGGFFRTMLRTFAWLVIASIIAWTVYFVWKFLRRGSAPSQANYSFER